jgi:hypothetical protein
MIIKDTALVYRRAELCNELRDDKYEIELDLNHKKIGIGMSGGMDSSILLWLLAHHISEHELDVTIYIWTCIHEEKPGQSVHAKKVVEFVKAEFPNVKFGEHMLRPTTAKDYIANGTKLAYDLVYKHGITALYNGVTLNPPNEIGEAVWKHKWETRAETRNWETRQKWIDENPVHNDEPPHTEYRPFIHADKRVVLAFYKKYGLYVSLGSLTRSCEGFIEVTNYFTETCKECWWCIEKEWATADIFNYEPKVMLDKWVVFSGDDNDNSN